LAGCHCGCKDDDDDGETFFEPHQFSPNYGKLQCWVSSLIPSYGSLGLIAEQVEEWVAIVDTGASITITPYKQDFIEYKEVQGQVVDGLVAGSQITGEGIVHWQVEVEGKIVNLKLRAVHVPESAYRLVCPQQVKREHWPPIADPTIGADAVAFKFAEGTVLAPYNKSNLPELKIANPKETQESLKLLNSCVVQELNQNLTIAQKELLKWHCKLGHLDMKRIQKLLKTGALGNNPKTKAAANMNLEKHPIVCGSCAYGKAKRRSARPKRAKEGDLQQTPEKLLSKDVLIPGQKVSMDHFIVSTNGCQFNSKGRVSQDWMFKGGVIFVDHASGYVFVEPVVNFTAAEALRAKRSFCFNGSNSCELSYQ
jgi:hypothetical protein